jgi:hypothetical protein
VGGRSGKAAVRRQRAEIERYAKENDLTISRVYSDVGLE